MKKLCGFLLVSSLLLLQSCQKELSVESGGAASVGSLQSDVSGDCLPKTVAGAYEEDVTLNGTNNYIELTLDISQTGAYVISTDTVNGIFFRAAGLFTTTGIQTLRLKGNGTPFEAGIHNFVVTYGTSSCVVAVTTLPAGAAGPAEFSLVGAPAACGGADVQGTYIAGTPLAGTNIVVLDINVTTIGTYSVTTTASNGMTFTGTGTLGATGPATITLNGSGTPAATGTTNIPVTAGTSTCSFDVVVSGPAVYTINCAGSVANGPFIAGTPLGGASSIDLNVNVATPGAYSISGTINGMTFTGTGTFTATGVQNIILAGGGTPAAEGDFSLPLTGGTAPCSVDITVEAGTGGTLGTFSFIAAGTTYTGTFNSAEFDNTTAPPFLFVSATGTTAVGDDLNIAFVDISGSIGAENYAMVIPTPPVPANFATFVFSTATLLYVADQSEPTNTLVGHITNHNVPTKTITGNFTGSAVDENGVLVPITSSSFSFTYP